MALRRFQTFSDLRHVVDQERQSLFLDGADGYNYVYRNRILERREARMYVDYEEADGEHSWSVPLHHDPSLPQNLQGIPPQALQVARAFREAGLASVAGLVLIASKWRPIPMNDTFSVRELRRLNRETYESALSQGLAGVPADIALEHVIERWQYPIYDLDLRLAEASREALEHRRLESFLHDIS